MNSGIYCIECLLSGDRYVGQSGNLQSRMRGHLFELKRGSHKNKHMQSSFNKYGEAQFRVYILEECQRNKSILCEREQFWIDKLNPKFNKAKVAGSTLGITLSKVTRKRISKAMANRKITWGKQISKSKKGKQHTTKAQFIADKKHSKRMKKIMKIRWDKIHGITTK